MLMFCQDALGGDELDEASFVAAALHPAALLDAAAVANAQRSLAAQAGGRGGELAEFPAAVAGAAALLSRALVDPAGVPAACLDAVDAACWASHGGGPKAAAPCP